MKHGQLVCALILLTAAFSSAAELPSREQMLADMLPRAEKFWKSLDKGPTPRLGCRALFDHALILCETRQYPERMEKLFDLAAQMQDRDPASKSYGNFRWYWNNERVFDYNAVDFCMQSAGLIWLKHRDFVPPAARAKLTELLELGTQGCLRHRVRDNYTNIAMMNAQNLIILGEALADKKAADEGYLRLDQQCLYIWENGIHEYDSPTYYGVDLDALGIIEAYAQRERGKQQATALLEYVWSDIGANYFWPAFKLAGTRSRDYDYLRGLGFLDSHLWLAGWIPAETMKSPSIHSFQTKWRPGETIRAMSQKKLPRLVRQTWGELEGEHKTHYVLPDVSLGSSGACYHNMDIPLSADLPGERTGVRCYVIADGRHDPYGKIKIPEGAAGGHEKTLHLKPFFQASQRLTDAAAIVMYRQADTLTQTLETHWVMPVTADAFYVAGRKIAVSAKEKLSIPVKIGEPVVLRRGTAAVGARVLWARGVEGSPAVMSFENDANAHGAVRLTVDHVKGAQIRQDEKIPGAPFLPPGAALWVRVGSGLKDDAAFEAWQKSFAQARAEVDGSAKEVDLKLIGEHGKLRVQADAPYTEGGTYDPPPSRVLLEIDGVDVGRKLLENIEPIKSYRQGQGDNALIAVPAKKGAYFEAESGLVQMNFAIKEDPAASGGKFVWLPGEPGGKGGGGIGSVTWRLNIADAGSYYLWGRVISPTSDDDSFNLRATASGREIMPLAPWPLGVHKDWTWVRFNLGDAREIRPLLLLDGEIRLQLKPREDGSKLDRLFITSDKDEQPR